MVLIESMASGTPIVAFERGSVPEIVKDGETGFIVNSVEDMVQAIGRIDRVDRRACRSHVVANFSIESMTEGYEALYQRLAGGRPSVRSEADRRMARAPMRPAQQRAAIG
jgi:glycosyltransferase involved in cell wall biosynthesis